MKILETNKIHEQLKVHKLLNNLQTLKELQFYFLICHDCD